MQTNKILSAPLIDLIFDGRYKDYGAYELRKNYSKRIKRALLVTLCIATAICTTVIFANSVREGNNRQRVGQEVILESLPEEKKIEKLPEPEQPRIEEPVRTEAYTAPAVVPDDQVDNPPPTMDDLDSAVISDITKPGVDPSDVPVIGDIDGKKNIIEPKPDPEPDEPFRTVEVDAKFVGNWRLFLEKTLNANTPVDNGAPPGRYSVVVEFVVDKDGQISNVIALTNHGYGMEAEAMRAIKKSKLWEPAIMNGHQVKAYKRQPIVFEVLED